MIAKGSPSNPVHLVRALLRECTYLPDPAARAYLRTYIVTRFREYWPVKHFLQTVPNASGCDSRSVGLPTESRRRGLLKQARKGLNTLSLANAGDPKALKKVLAHTYGRTGKRRHELMRFLREADNHDNHEDVTRSAITSADNALEKSPLTSRMEALVKSQKGQKTDTLSRLPIRRLSPKIPETNTWGRPMPLKRVRNMKKMWYADLLDKVLPPLPTHEWQRLRDLSQGNIKWSGVVPRRGSSFQVSSKVNGNPHRLTTRYMQRIWATVFVQCPVMTFNTSTSKWNVQWGSIHETSDHHTTQKLNKDDSVFFRGVADNGSLLKGSTSRQT